MFGKKDLVHSLSDNLDRARARRDALASDVTTLAAQIAELEARLSEETSRRERERIETEIEDVKQRLQDGAAKFTPAIARLCEATSAAAAVVPEARELHALLTMVATEVADEIEVMLCELHRLADAVRGGEPPASLPPPPERHAQRKTISDRVPLLLPPFLPRNSGAQKLAPQDERRSTAA
jgi:outer membrane murein-binding lipoprotein Lpp